jgi:HD-GYP domain-containing protein (c-di-GMP phosphodiesterase class II)
MDHEDTITKERLAIGDVRPGMYIVGLDRSWLQTPFLFHRKLIQSSEEIDQLKKHGIREVVIDPARGVDIAEHRDDSPVKARQVASLLTEDPDPLAATQAVAVQPPLSAAELAFQPLARELDNARAVREETLTLAQTIFDGVGAGARIDGKIAAQVVTQLQASIARSPEANLLLMQMRRFQKDLFTHSVNVCVLALVVATAENLGDDIATLGMAALLHDVGETRLPRALLRKPTNFTDAEAGLLKQHPALGAALLAQTRGIDPSAQSIVLAHHERIDGSGYPSGATDLSLYSQIVALTDSYDDMLTGRNQNALQPTEVLRQLYLQANTRTVERDLVEKVIRSLGVYPIGSVVELNTGERGVVVATNRAAALKPVVRVIMSRSGLVQFNGPIIGLADAAPKDAIERRIVGVLDPMKERVDPLVFMRLAPGVLA